MDEIGTCVVSNFRLKVMALLPESWNFSKWLILKFRKACALTNSTDFAHCLCAGSVFSASCMNMSR